MTEKNIDKKSNIMNQKEYNDACRMSEFLYCREVIKEQIFDVIDLVITKARSFPDYPINELKNEAWDWLSLKSNKR